MENQNAQNTEFMLTDFVRVFKKNVIKIIIVALIVAMGVGMFAIFNTTYGVMLSYHITPGDQSDDLIHFLSSESFAEKLLLDENGLPSKNECDAKDYDAAIAAINLFEEKRKAKAELSQEIDKMPNKLASIRDQYERIVAEYDRAYALLKTYLDMGSDSYADREEYRASVVAYEKDLAEAKAERKAFEENVYHPQIDLQRELSLKLEELNTELKYARIDMKEAVEKVVAPWREKNKEKISRINSAIAFEYIEHIEHVANEESNKEGTLNKEYLNVYVTVEDDEEFSNEITSALKEKLGIYVQKHIEEKTAVTRVECNLLSTASDTRIIGRSVMVNAVLYGAIGFIGTSVVLYIVFVIADLLKKATKVENTQGKVASTDEEGKE